MSRSARLQKKLLSRHILTVAENAVMNENLVNYLWSLKQGESLNLNAESLESEPLEKYGISYTITRGPIPGHWLHDKYNPDELSLFFTANGHEDICHGWLLFKEEET